VTVVDKQGKLIRTIPVRKVDAGVNRIVWDLHYDRPVPLTPQEEEQVARAEASGGGFGPQRSGPGVDPGEYTVEVAVGSDKSSTKIEVDEDPRIDWFSAADRAKRRAVIDELVNMTRQADVLRKKFTAVDTQFTAYETAWNKPDAPKMPDTVKKAAATLKTKLSELRPTMAQRGFGGGGGPPAPLSAEELAKPEPDFVLPAIPGRVQGAIRELESTSTAPDKAQLHQVELVKEALANATQAIDRLLSEDVARLNKAMSDAKVPYLSVPEK
jgi:hypothetical protein